MALSPLNPMLDPRGQGSDGGNGDQAGGPGCPQLQSEGHGSIQSCRCHLQALTLLSSGVLTGWRYNDGPTSLGHHPGSIRPQVLRLGPHQGHLVETQASGSLPGRAVSSPGRAWEPLWFLLRTRE